MQNPLIRVCINDRPPVSVPLFTLISWKGALRLEAAGMKHSKGSASAAVRKAFNLPQYVKTPQLRAIVVQVLDNHRASLA